MGLMQEPLFTGTNDPSSTLNGTQRWITPSLNEIASMLDKVEGKIRKEDDEWVAIAQSVANQQNSYAAYQADMEKKGVTDQKHDSYKPFAIWARGETATKDYSDIYSGPKGRGDGKPPVTGALEAGGNAGGNAGGPSPVTGALEAGGNAGGPSPVTGALEAGGNAGGTSPVTGVLESGVVSATNPYATMSKEQLLSLLRNNGPMVVNKQLSDALTVASFEERLSKEEKELSTLTPTEVSHVTTDEYLGMITDPSVTPDITAITKGEMLDTNNSILERKMKLLYDKKYILPLLRMLPNERVSYLKSVLDSEEGAKLATQLQGIEARLGELVRTSHKDTVDNQLFSDVYRNIKNFRVANQGRVDQIFLRSTIENIPLAKGLANMLISDDVEQRDFAEWYEVLASDLGEIAAYAITSKVVGSAFKFGAKAASKVGKWLKINDSPFGGGAISKMKSDAIKEVNASWDRMAESADRQHTASLTGKDSNFRDFVTDSDLIRHNKLRLRLEAIEVIEKNPTLNKYFEGLSGGSRADSLRKNLVDNVALAMQSGSRSLSTDAISNAITKTAQTATQMNSTPIITTTVNGANPVTQPLAAPTSAASVVAATSVTPQSGISIPSIFKQYARTSAGKKIFDSGMLGTSTPLTQSIVDSAASDLASSGAKITNKAILDALRKAARLSTQSAAPAAMAAGVYYTQEAEDAMSQIVEQLSALGLN